MSGNTEYMQWARVTEWIIGEREGGWKCQNCKDELDSCKQTFRQNLLEPACAVISTLLSDAWIIGLLGFN